MGRPIRKDVEDPPTPEHRPKDEARKRSRLHMLHVHEEPEPDPTETRDGDGDARRYEVPVAVVEQRVSNLAQGALCLVLLTGPFLHVLSLIPRGVLASLL